MSQACLGKFTSFILDIHNMVIHSCHMTGLGYKNKVRPLYTAKGEWQIISVGNSYLVIDFGKFSFVEPSNCW